MPVLCDQMSEHARVARADAVHRQRNRQFMDIWDKVLKFEQSRIEKSSPKLRYLGFTDANGTLTFSMSSPIPDDLDWVEDAPIAVTDEQTERYLLVGNLAEVRGDTIIVEPNNSRFRAGVGVRSIPRAGMLTRDLSEALASIRRQKVALSLFRAQEICNPRMAQLLVEPTQAEFGLVKRDLTFCQQWLDDDKKEVIRKALSAQDLFILKGPPGTGKTSVIAEVILQILHDNPSARILITSQSNVAVDHALSQVALANPSVPEMVRLGRQEKVSREAEAWLIEARRNEWRQRIEKHCSSVLSRLTHEKNKASGSKRENGEGQRDANAGSA